MDIRRPTKSEFKEIIRSFSSDGRSEPPDDDLEGEPRSISPMDMAEKHDEDGADEMYFIYYYGDEEQTNGNGNRAEGKSREESLSEKPEEKNEQRGLPKSTEEPAQRRQECVDKSEDEGSDREEDRRKGNNTVGVPNPTTPKLEQITAAFTQQSAITEEELLSKEIEDDRNLLEEELRTTVEPDDVEKRIKESEADARELLSVEKRINEIEVENKDLLKVSGEVGDASHRQRVQLAREIRELKKEVAQLRISISGRDDNLPPEIDEECDSEEDNDFCITVGIFVKLLMEDEEFYNYFLSLKQQVSLANDMIVDLLGAQFPSVKIERQSSSLMERRLGRALMDKLEYREILEQFAASTAELNELRSNYDSQETIGEFQSEGNDHFLITVGRFVKWLLENDDIKQFYASCKAESNADDLGMDLTEQGYSRGVEEHSDLWLEHRIGKRLVEMAELEEIIGGFKTHPNEVMSTEAMASESVDNEEARILAERYREIENEIAEKLESDSSSREKYLMLRKRIRELKGPVSDLAIVETRESVIETDSETNSETDSETEEETDEETMTKEDVVAYLQDELKSENVKELWDMVDDRLKAIENDKARMMEGKIELDTSMARLLEMQQNLIDRSGPGWTQEMLTEMKAVKTKLKQIEKEKYNLSEEYMKIDAEKVNLEAVVERIRKKEQVLTQLMEVSKSITKVQSIVRSVRRDSDDTSTVTGDSNSEAKKTEEAGETAQSKHPRKKKVSLKLQELSKSLKDLQEALMRRRGTDAEAGSRAENDAVIQQLKELSNSIGKVQGLVEKVTNRKPSLTREEEVVEETGKTAVRRCSARHDSTTSYSTPVFISIAAATALALVGILHSR